MEKPQETLIELPPAVEGREATLEEIKQKRANGRLYLNDVWLIVREFPSAEVYETRSNLPNLVNSVGAAIHEIGFLAADASSRLDGLHHALHLAEAFASIVREARTQDVFQVLRRTPRNCGAMLMLQRQEHVRGNVSEASPIALIVLCRGEQLLLTREEVPDHSSLCTQLVEMAIQLIQKEGEGMPAALHKQQMGALKLMMQHLNVPVSPLVEEEEEIVIEGLKGVKLGGEGNPSVSI